MDMRHSRRAFTLLELLCVVAIVSLLVALSLRPISRAYHKARRTIAQAWLLHDARLRVAGNPDASEAGTRYVLTNTLKGFMPDVYAEPFVKDQPWTFRQIGER